MSKLTLRGIAIGLLCAWAIVSVYIYSRFTVDDAFITWRYGKNLVEHGVWNYNPNLADPTQAYTNPIYAVIGILPQLIGCDVVLFFKVFSVTLYCALGWWALRIAGRDWYLAVLLMGLPATVIHTFSGLETTLYGFLVALLLVDLHRGLFLRSLCWTLVLFLVRPEAWILAFAVPVHWLLAATDVDSPEVALAGRLKLNWPRAARASVVLGLPLAGYFALHYHIFGEFLPNTFFAKAKGVFELRTAIKCCLSLLPLFVLISRRTLGPALVAATLFGASILSYSTSDLQMNYAARFAFHIFLPAYCFGLYAHNAVLPAVLLERKSLLNWLRRCACSTVALVGVAAAFFMFSGRYPTYCNTYYQRLLNGHAEFGKSLKNVAKVHGIRAVAVGDAGAIAYHADLPVLDPVGLGSRLLTKYGASASLFKRYNIDIVVLFTKNREVDRAVYNQGALFDWAQSEGMGKIGDLYFEKDYALAVYARRPIPKLVEVCNRSKQAIADAPDEVYRQMVLSPPWYYWHE